MTTPPQDPNARYNYNQQPSQYDAQGQYGQGQAAQGQYSQGQYNQYGQAQQLHPQVEKDLKNAKIYSIVAIVLAGISYIILGFLSLPALIMGIWGLVLSNKLQSAGVLQGNSKTLSIIAIIASGIALLLYILGIINMIVN